MNNKVYSLKYTHKGAKINRKPVQMPQIFQVLKCYKCSVFQVHQTKKSIKWDCKLCGEKQSIKRHYGLGTGRECRIHVQKLNVIRGEINELNESVESNKSSNEEDMQNVNTPSESTAIFNKGQVRKESKWTNFVDKTEQITEPEENESMYLGNTEVVLEMPVKKRRKFNTPKIIHKATTSYENNNVEESMPHHKKTRLCKPDLSKAILSNENSYKSGDTILDFSKIKLPEKENSYTTLEINSVQKNYKSEINNANLQSDTLLNIPLLPKVNRNSKWAQFTDEVDVDEKPISQSKENLISSNKDNPSVCTLNNLFTLCDENELDDVLDL